MQKERYEILDGVMYLIDPELDLNVCEPFTLPLVPRIEEKNSLLESLEVVWNRDEEGRFETAYFKKEGLFHGQHLHFYPCGKIKGESFYLDGKLHGPSLFHSVEGVVLASSWFYDGCIVGKSRQFYGTGALYSIQQYKKGKLHGKQEYFYEDSSFKTALMYKEGDLEGLIELFWPSGQIKRRAFFEKGLRKGEDCIWSESGILLDFGQYVEGTPLGKQQKSYSNGVLKEELYYHPSGLFDRLLWNEQGQLLYEGIYLDKDTFQETTKKWPEGTVQVRKGKWDGRELYFE